MAGHSKWANIQHRKGAHDSRRGKVFNKLIRELTVATRIGGSDQGSNGRLRLAVDKARAASMSKEDIEQVISRAAGDRIKRASTYPNSRTRRTPTLETRFLFPIAIRRASVEQLS